MRYPKMNDMPDKIPGDEYVLHMNAETARIVARACELFSRLLFGQFQEVRYLTLHPTEKDDPTFSDRLGVCEKALQEARDAAFPEFLHQYGRSYGVGHDRDADTAWNAYQAIRYIQAWHEHPEGGDTVNFYEPMRFSDAPMPRCEVRDGNAEWHDCFVDPNTGQLIDIDAEVEKFAKKYGDQ